MDVKALAIPGTIQHSRDARSDADLRGEVTAHHDAHPGVRFLADVLTAVHSAGDPVRIASVFHAQFAPRVVMDALERRPDLRARVAHAITGGPLTLLRRIPPADLAAQIELLVAEDLPADERNVRAVEDRDSTVAEIYLKYVDASDLAAYLPPRDLWTYEGSDAWWDKPGEIARRLMATEIKSIRRHKILSDSELLDQIGNEVLERDLSVRVRTEIRAAARKLAADGKPFTDTAMFESIRSSDGQQDLVDEIVGSVPLSHLRQIVVRAADLLGLTASGTPTSTTPTGVDPTVSRAANTAVPSAAASTRAGASSARTSPSIPPPAMNSPSASTSIVSHVIEPARSPSIVPAAVATTTATATVPNGVVASTHSVRPPAATSPSMRPPAFPASTPANPAVAPAATSASIVPSARVESAPSATTRASTVPAARTPSVAPRASVSPGPLSVSPDGNLQPMVELVDDETYGEDRTNSGADGTSKEGAIKDNSGNKPVEIPDFEDTGMTNVVTAPNARSGRRSRS